MPEVLDGNPTGSSSRSASGAAAAAAGNLDGPDLQALGRSAPVLGPGSKVEDLRRRLKELGCAIYGSKEVLWKCLLEAVTREDVKAKERIYLEERAQELELAGEP